MTEEKKEKHEKKYVCNSQFRNDAYQNDNKRC